jgi:adsorption protein B
MAAPRLIVSNFVNFFAAVRATRIYIDHSITGRPLVWDKTTHTYPIKFHRDTAPVEGNRRGIADLAPVTQDTQWAPQ